MRVKKEDLIKWMRINAIEFSETPRITSTIYSFSGFIPDFIELEGEPIEKTPNTCEAEHECLTQTRDLIDKYFNSKRGNK